VIRVLIADEHPLLREGVVHALALEPDFAAPGEAGSSHEVLRMLEKAAWDVIVLGLSMPGRGGLETLSEIRRLKRTTPVLVLTAHSEVQFVLRAIKAGANGYITKNASPSEIVAAIRKVAAGKSYFTPAVAESLAASMAFPGSPPPNEELTDREFLVACRIAAGKTVSQIAGEISLSVKTVHIYRARTLKKLGVRTNAELTRYALQRGWVV